MRYFKATLIIGTLSSILVAVLYAAGWLSTTPELILAKTYGMANPTKVSAAMQISIAVILAYLAAWTTVDITRPLLKGVVAVSGIFLLLTCSRVLVLYNVFFSPFPAVAAVLVAFLIGLMYGGSSSGARKKVLERLFGQRISQKQFNALVNADIPANFPGALHEGTVIVCEVHNHRELMEVLTPENYAAMTNLYLQTASDFLVEIGGYLDECNGESLRVVFGAPLPDDKHAERSCRASLDLLSRLDNLNKECDATWQRRFDFRIGVNSGEMITAAYGGARLGSFSVAGPAVEFARRLCAACATYGCRILVGPETYESAMESVEARPIESFKTQGVRRRVEIYEILSPKHGLSTEREASRDHFWRGVIYYREGQWDRATEEFTKARLSGLPDPALDFYIRRVESSRRGDKLAEREQTELSSAF
jgi:adenylate cyclase